MSEPNIVVKTEIEDPSYNETYVNSTAPDIGHSYEVSTEFVDITIKKEYINPPVMRQIKEEPLDLSPAAVDSPQLPDSTTGPPLKTERCVEVEVTVDFDPVERNCEEQKNEEEMEPGQPDEKTKNIAALYEERSRKNELKKQFTIENGKFSCKLCHKLYMTKASIVRHLLQHPEEDFITPPPTPEIYKCEKCGKTFKCSSNLQQHSYIHLDEKQFKCEKCERSFTLKSNLIRHQGKDQCSFPDERFRCNICNASFDKESLLNGHLKKHTVGRPYACNDCDMRFKYRCTLVRHVQHHNGVKPHACNICGKTFTSFGLIKPHMRMHTGEKPYSCPICSKKFSHKHNMQRHTVRHDKVVNLNCPVCDKKFPKESRLKYHMRTHMDEKHFDCGICPKKFSHRQNVIRHYARKHPNSIYQSTETDASVALKLWNEVKNNERQLPAVDLKRVKKDIQNHKVANENDKFESENETNSELTINFEEEVEEILPDVTEKPQVAFEVVSIKVENDMEEESTD